MRIALLLAFVAIGLVPSSRVLAIDVLIDQASDFAFETTPNAWTSNVDATDQFGWQTYDNFRMLGGGQVTQMSWQGYYGDAAPENNPPQPNTAEWRIRFFSDRRGSPGPLISESVLPARQVRATPLGLTDNNSNVFEFRANLPEAFVAEQDVPYWLSVESVAAASGPVNPFWAWIGAAGDDWRTLQRPAPAGNYELRGDDRAFSLNGVRTGQLPSAGVSLPQFESLDTTLQNFMHAHTIEASALAVMRDGEVVYHRGFGWKDPGHQSTLDAHAMMRLASISKPITAATVRSLASQGLFSLDDKVFNLGQDGGGILELTPFPTLGDARYADMTVRDLLRHEAGWDRSISPDYAAHPNYEWEMADALGVATPVSRQDRARYVLGTPLDHAPGTTYAYSNIGYHMLGLVIEAATGQDYLDAVHEQVFQPLGIPQSEVEVGRTLPADRNLREPWYDQPESSDWLAPNVYDPLGPVVPYPDGAWSQEAYASFGGLIASTKALVHFADNYVLFGNNSGRPRTAAFPGIDGHAGSLLGTDTVLYNLGNDVSFALLFNRRPTGGTSYVSQVSNQIIDILTSDDLVWPSALVDLADGTGDGWVTVEDAVALSSALRAHHATDYATEYPSAHYLAFDFDGDRVVSGLDVPLAAEVFQSYGYSLEELAATAVPGDFDIDWQLTASDHDTLYANLGTDNGSFDVNGDNVVDFDDVTYWIEELFQTVAGDADLNGIVNAADLNVVGRNWLAGVSSWSEGDFNGDQLVNAQDLNAIGSNWLQTISPAPLAAVPEPSGFSLLMVFATTAFLTLAPYRRMCGQR